MTCLWLLRAQPVNRYPPLIALALHQLRKLIAIESFEALQMAREAGLEAP